MNATKLSWKLINIILPSILLMLELCISGQAFRIFLLSSLAQTMKAFIGLLMCGLLTSDFSFWARIIFAPNILPGVSKKSHLLAYLQHHVFCWRTGQRSNNTFVLIIIESKMSKGLNLYQLKHNSKHRDLHNFNCVILKFTLWFMCNENPNEVRNKVIPVLFLLLLFFPVNYQYWCCCDGNSM